MTTPATENKIKPKKIPVEEIQGLIVRGYNMNFVRHFILTTKDPYKAKSFIGDISKSEREDGLSVMTGAPWKTKMIDGKEVAIKPDIALNISFTYPGILSLNIKGFTDNTFDTFDSFRKGAPKQAYYIGDFDESSPDHWDDGFKPDQIHCLVSIYTMTEEERESRSESVRQLFKDGFEEIRHYDGNAFPDGKIQFGYKDGISQPNVDGFPYNKIDGGQYPVPAWNFVIKDDDYQLDYEGYEILPPASKPESPLKTIGAAPYKVPNPRVLGMWGSFAAFRVLEQDVVAFEEFLQSQKDTIDPELLAAKLCGRWRSGTPLALHPDKDTPVDDAHLNNFNYLKPAKGAPNERDDPDTTNDLLGMRCPIGAHMRRNNPRNSPVSSNVALHRIIRRGMPYGPIYDPSKPYDGKERGLLGLFICASIESQFEFLMHNWVNGDDFAPDILGTKDPLLGANSEDSSKFVLAKGPDTQDNKEIKGFQRFITTRGSAYVFFPSRSALQFIADS